MGVLLDDDIDKKPVQNELFQVDRTYDYLPQGTFWKSFIHYVLFILHYYNIYIYIYLTYYIFADYAMNDLDYCSQITIETSLSTDLLVKISDIFVTQAQLLCLLDPNIFLNDDVRK
jgi:hypothetical protein